MTTGNLTPRTLINITTGADRVSIIGVIKTFGYINLFGILSRRNSFHPSNCLTKPSGDVINLDQLPTSSSVGGTYYLRLHTGPRL